MSFHRLGAAAALVCAATYIFGFVVLLAVLAPTGYGSQELDSLGVAKLINDMPALMLAWNTGIYIINALALVVLVVSLKTLLDEQNSQWGTLSQAFGLVWCTLVLGAGMLANVTVEQTTELFVQNPQAAADLWQVLHAVELGLGGGNEIAGGVWIFVVSSAALAARVLPKIIAALGVLVGASGLLTVIPPLGEITGVIFGLGAILWFLLVGFSLLRSRAPAKLAAA